MSARISVSPDRVSVSILGRLSYDCWEVMRDARLIARERHLPLYLNFEDCRGGDMGGLGALLLAQDDLGEATLGGCNDDFVRWFNSIGVCGHCGGRDVCARRAAIAEGLRGVA